MIPKILKMGKTIIAAIRDINIALMYCDYIYALKDGNLVAQRTSDIISPKLIRELYEVKSRVLYDKENKTRYVLYNKASF